MELAGRSGAAATVRAAMASCRDGPAHDELACPPHDLTLHNVYYVNLGKALKVQCAARCVIYHGFTSHMRFIAQNHYGVNELQRILEALPVLSRERVPTVARCLHVDRKSVV